MFMFMSSIIIWETVSNYIRSNIENNVCDSFVFRLKYSCFHARSMGSSEKFFDFGSVHFVYDVMVGRWSQDINSFVLLSSGYRFVAMPWHFKYRENKKKKKLANIEFVYFSFFFFFSAFSGIIHRFFVLSLKHFRIESPSHSLVCSWVSLLPC